MSTLAAALWALSAWLCADFLSGLIHWWEDRALTSVSRWRFLNGVRADNERHHLRPTALTELTWWSNISTTAPFAWLIAALAALTGHGFAALVLAFLGFGNLIHRWSHDHRDDRPALVIAAQRIGLFASPSHHAGHHFLRGKKVERADAAIRFCVMSDWLNPVLDRIGLWRLLNRAFGSV